MLTVSSKVLLEPGYVLEPDCNNQASQLRETGRIFYDDKYKGHFDNFFSSVRSWFMAFNEDPVSRVSVFFDALLLMIDQDQSPVWRGLGTPDT